MVIPVALCISILEAVLSPAQEKGKLSLPWEKTSLHLCAEAAMSMWEQLSLHPLPFPIDT